MESSKAPNVVTTSDGVTHQTLNDDFTPMSLRERGKAFTFQDKDTKNVDNYFNGPRDTTHHSKWPNFLRLHGSVMPHMILPMTVVALWSTFIYLLCHNLKIRLRFDPVLLTVTGFLVGLALSFRSTTGYERYMEGRKLWAQLTLTTQSIARIVWTHAKEREDHKQEDLLAKVTCLQLLVSFAVALKHKLRFEPYIEYDDLSGLAGYLDTYAKKANEGVDTTPRKYSVWKRAGEFLGLSFANSNPRKELKRAQKPLGNLPLEILNHIQGYLEMVVENGTLKTPVFSAPVANNLQIMNDILVSTDRILNTPLPMAYRIVISQITWLYILALPMQLYDKLGFRIIPATLAAAYIILGLALIGSQIEDPFGDDVNDLPLEMFCDQIAHDIDVITSAPAPKPGDFMTKGMNRPLFPLSQTGHPVWVSRSEEQIREALRMKVEIRHRQMNTAKDKGSETSSVEV